ncbi:hypothetical protein FRC09_002490 [Ceratobasidium sp. 395]|nr:hypothetical protein FRC09_002490 [Ceratobasidium sp. 395]
MPYSFDGKQGKEAQTFLTKMGLYFADAKEGTFNDKRKIVQTLLDMNGGDSSSWAQPLLIKLEAGEDHEFLELWEECKKAFLINFGDPVKKDRAMRALNSLVQTTSVSHYATQFRKLAQEVDWNHEALMDKFKLGLKPDVQQELRKGNIYVDSAEEGSLEQWIALACKIDDILYENQKLMRKREQGSTHSNWAPKNQGTNTNRNAQGPNKSTGTTKPKSTVRIPLEEKNRRKAAGLCLKCGNPGHIMADCKGDWTFNKRKVQGKASAEKDQEKGWDSESEN